MAGIDVLFIGRLRKRRLFEKEFSEGYKLHTAVTLDKAAMICCLNEVKILVVSQDIHFKNEVLQRFIARHHFELRLLITSENPEHTWAKNLKHDGIFQYTIRPCEPQVLKRIITCAFEIEAAARLKDSLEQEWIIAEKRISCLRA